MLSFLIYSSVLILLVMSLIHFYWVFGGRWGVGAAIPVKADGIASFSPGRIETLIVAVGLLVVGFMLLAQYEMIHLFGPNPLTKWFCIIFSFVFIMRAVGDFKYLGFFKKITHTTFAKYDTWFYSPLCLYLGFSFMMVWV